MRHDNGRETYRTNFCGKHHDIETGGPFNHECHMLSARTLRLERAGSDKVVRVRAGSQIVKGTSCRHPCCREG